MLYASFYVSVCEIVILFERLDVILSENSVKEHKFVHSRRQSAGVVSCSVLTYIQNIIAVEIGILILGVYIESYEISEVE